MLTASFKSTLIRMFWGQCNHTKAHIPNLFPPNLQNHLNRSKDTSKKKLHFLCRSTKADNFGDQRGKKEEQLVKKSIGKKEQLVKKSIGKAMSQWSLIWKRSGVTNT